MSGSYNQDKNLKQRIEQLPLDIKQITFSKIWEKIEPKKGFVVKSGQLLFAFCLHYLICQYKKLKLQTKNKIPKAYATWTGHQILDHIYIFPYGPVN